MGERERDDVGLPTALTVIKAIAAAEGVLRGGEAYLTKYEMIRLCKTWLAAHRDQVKGKEK